MNGLTHRTVESNGIRMHVAEAGRGTAGRCCAMAFPNPGTRGATSCRRSPWPGSARWRPTCAATAGPTGPKRSTSTRCCI